MTRVLCVGIAVVDFLFRYPELPAKPGKHIAQSFEAVMGGMAANAAAAAAKLGCDAALLSRVGEDANGGFTLAELTWHSIALPGVEHVRAVPPSLPGVASGDEGARMLFNPQARRLLLDAPAPPASGYRRFDALLDDTRWPAAGAQGLQLAAERGVPGIA